MAARTDRRPRLVYVALAIGGWLAIVAGVAMIFVPGAFILGGLAAGLFGMVGLGMEVRR
jgi:hypothetical protein